MIIILRFLIFNSIFESQQGIDTTIEGYYRFNLSNFILPLLSENSKIYLFIDLLLLFLAIQVL